MAKVVFCIPNKWGCRTASFGNVNATAPLMANFTLNKDVGCDTPDFCGIGSSKLRIFVQEKIAATERAGREE